MATILFQQRPIQLALWAYILSLFLGSRVYLIYNPPVYGALVNTIDQYVVFVVSLGSILFLVNMFIKEVVESRRKNQKLLQDLLDANTESKRLNYMVSHDLRSPLRQMAVFSDLAKMANTQQNTEEVKEHLDFIGTSARRLHTLTEDLLSLAQIDHESLQKEVFSVAVLMDKVVQQFSQNDQLVIRQQADDVSLEGNPMLIGLVLQNLIENSIKYNNSTPKIIELRAALEGSSIAIEVQDNGIGIPEGQEDAMFNMFTRLHDKQRYQGSGIGLAIAQKVVSIHQGEISAMAQAEGSLFRIQLPRQAKHTVAQAADINRKTGSQQLYRLSQKRRALF